MAITWGTRSTAASEQRPFRVGVMLSEATRRAGHTVGAPTCTGDGPRVASRQRRAMHQTGLTVAALSRDFHRMAAQASGEAT